MRQDMVAFRQSFESVVDHEREEELVVVLCIPVYTARDVSTAISSL
jgi:hypothetical protein